MAEPITLDFGVCRATWHPAQQKVIVAFPDGTEAHATPHYTPAYAAHAADKSTGSIADYCWQHELAHIVVGLSHGRASHTLWNLAHGLPTDTEDCLAEEIEAQEWQRRFFRREADRG